MGVLTASNESSENETIYHRNLDLESELYSSNEETKLLQQEKESSSESKKKYPKSIFFIIGNEFCERFTYYGLRTVLTIYLTQRLFYSDDTATMIYHLFTMLAYFTPVLGAIIADSWLGKYRTILYLSILYACGGIILSFGAFPNELNTMTLISLIGLFIIGLGTGGIKPCVSAFGGDQFKAGQEKQLQQFFSLFYMSINLGSLFSTFLTPILREDVHCLGENSCFPIAFGVPSMLMIVALLLFVCGKPLYTIKPPEGNIVVTVAKCICYAITKKSKISEKKKSHWLDYADDKYDKKLIGDIKTVFHVLVLYIPLPVFWALFDQQGSRWTLQATRLDGKINGWHIKADQMQVINPLLIIVFIPLFDYIIYPLLAKCHLLRKPLQRITTGGILTAISFVIAGLIELKLEGNLPVMPSPGHSQLIIINNSPCSIKIEGTDLPTLDDFATTTLGEVPLHKQHNWMFSPENCSLAVEPSEFSFNSSNTIESMMITVYDGKIRAIKMKDTKTKAKSGEPQVRFLYNTDPIENGNVTFYLKNDDGIHEYYINTNTKKEEEEEDIYFGMTEHYKFVPGKYKIYLPFNNSAFQETPIAEENFKSGGVYIVSIYNKTQEKMREFSKYTSVSGNQLSILYQIPQYVIITAGEIMFSITGLEFSYSQSPTSMKSVVQAAWLLTVAFGNLIVLVIAKLKLFEKQSYELFLFAALMGVVMVIFAIQSYFYKYVKTKTQEEEEVDISSPREKSKESYAKSNDGYVEETDFNK